LLAKGVVETPKSPRLFSFRGYAALIKFFNKQSCWGRYCQAQERRTELRL